MADELDLELDDSAGQEQDEFKSKAEKRITNLSNKVKTTAEERDRLAEEKAKIEAEKAQALKDLEFFKKFNTISSKYQGSADFQDKIKEKFDSGYDLEDAAVAILAKENRYTPPPVPVAPKESPAGGSSSTAIKSGDKGLSDMSADEKRKLLEDTLGLT